VFSKPFGSPFGTGRIPPSEDKVLRIEKFASKIFCINYKLLHVLCCTAKGIHGFVRAFRAKQRGINRFPVAGTAAKDNFSARERSGSG
jgi:hypothetical protein